MVTKFGKWDTYDDMPANLRSLTFTQFLNDCKASGLDLKKDSDEVMKRFNKLFRGVNVEV